jgi:predicted DNA-binding protein (MmcQ/YjbR family)
MTPAALRAWCLRQPGAVEEFPFGPDHSVFKVGGKLFAITALEREPLEVSAKCEPELAVQLRDTYPAVRPGYHLNKRHWNTVTVDGSLPDRLVRTSSRTPTTSSSPRCPCASARPSPADRPNVPDATHRCGMWDVRPVACSRPQRIGRVSALTKSSSCWVVQHS